MNEQISLACYVRKMSKLPYSVGWNESDEGGTPGLTGRANKPEPSKGDWVWRYSAAPANATEP